MSYKISILAPFFLFSSTLIVSCGAPSDQTQLPPPPSQPASLCGGGDAPFRLLAQEENNYSITSNLTIENVVVGGRNPDITFDWSAVTTDFYGHSLEQTADIATVVVIVWDLGLEGIAQGLAVEDPDLTSHVVFPIVLNPLEGQTSASLREFMAFGEAVLEEDLITYLDPSLGYTYTLMLQRELKLGSGVGMIQAFTVDGSNTETHVVMTNDSTILQVLPDLDSPLSSHVPSHQPDIVMDWSNSIATRASGGEFISNQITEVIVGQYAGDIDLTAEFLDIEYVYRDLWRGTVSSGSEIHLETLLNASGEPFPGIEEGDQYLLGLLCTTCINPTPWYLSRLTPCE
jgi:hypothetical protein